MWEEGEDSKEENARKRHSESSSTPAKKTKVQSVLDVPPSQYNAGVFKANNPFVSVYEQSPNAKKILKGDKIGDGKWMQRDALNQCIKTMIDSPARASMSFTENGGRIVHGSHVLDLWLLTKPSSGPREEISVDDLEGVDAIPAGAEGDEEVTGLVIEHTEQTERESTESLDIRHEGDDPDGETKDEKTRYDFELLAHSSLVSLGLNDLVSMMYIECAWDAMSKRKLYQAGAYACRKGAIHNMKKGRYEPIFVEAWGEAKWMYGVLYLKGVVTISNGKIVDVKSKFPVDNGRLEKTLQASTERMRKDFPRNSPDAYPDGEYVLGALYISRKRYSLPDVKTAGSGAWEDSRLFYQSLLRVVVGDKVLAWTKQDVEDAKKRRLDQLEDVKDRFLGISS